MIRFENTERSKIKLTMKTRQLIIIPVMACALYIPALAHMNNYSDTPAENRSGVVSQNYAPVAPREAGFDEEYSSDAPVSNALLKALAPVTPAEAEFTDDTDTYTAISPVTPQEAGFDETV